MRIITPENKPSNIAVFKAATLFEARQKAQEHNDAAGIQASVWHTPPAPVSWESEVRLGNAYEKAMGLKANITNCNIIMTSRAGQNSFGFYPRGQVPDELLEDTRKRNIETIGAEFSEIQLAVRHSAFGDLRKHRDRDDMHANERKAKHMHRILHARNGAGTWLYASDDATEQPWELANGSYLFLPHRHSPLEKSALHSNPAFKLPANVRPRTIDVYDF